MVYLNNAATSFPKPDAVREAYRKAGDSLPPGQFRSTFENSDEDVFPTCRERLGRLLGAGNKDRVFFSSGATESLNALICGFRIKADDIITTVTEHNSVLRPLYNIPQIKGRPRLVSCDETGYVDPERIETEAGKGGAKAIILNHCSNVTGAIQDAKAIGEIAKRYGLTYILDASQSAGCIDVKADDWGVDALAFTGHKSLMGIQGTGGYYVREGISFRPLKYGGTGLDSSRISYEDEQYEYEVGTQNGVGIAVLSAAVAWVLEQGVEKIAEKEAGLMEYLNDGLSGIRGIRTIGTSGRPTGPVLSFTSDTLDPSDLAYILQNSYGIVTRAGLHCAPLIHDHIGSGSKGTLRVSLSYMNSRSDVDALLSALQEIQG